MESLAGKDMVRPGEKILIVDSMSMVRKLIAKACNEIGILETLEAIDGGNAWEMMNANPVSLILCEWDLPKGNGLDLLKRVRSDSRLGNLPFIMMSTVLDSDLVKEVLKVGNSNFMLKPFTPKNLEEKIKVLKFP